MKNVRKLTASSLLSFSLLASLLSCTQKSADSEAAKAPPAPAYYTPDDFDSVDKIDAHVHISTEDTSFIEQVRADNFRLLTINVDVPSAPPIEEQRALAIGHAQQFPERVAYATTLSVKNWNEPAWQEQTIAYLKDSFAKGAIAVKVWKNIGMELRDQEGRFVMIDHPRFDPVLDYLEQQKIPLVSHQGEPKNCWLPVAEMTVQGDKNYFSEHPQYHMYLHPEYPAYEDQIRARDHMLEKHPGLQVVSVHLGSLEWSVDELAKRLDKYPNMAVDMAARISHLQHQAVTDWQKVHDFLIKYQDRLLYATDLDFSARATDPAETYKHAHDTWLQDWRFFVTDEVITNRQVTGEFKGMKLPREVVDKIFRENAEKWLPGMTASR